MYSVLVFAVCLFVVLATNPLACPICDQNDYNPVCAEGKAYGNLCKLKREICLGNVVLSSGKYGTCRVLKEPVAASRLDDHDNRIMFRLLFGGK